MVQIGAPDDSNTLLDVRAKCEAVPPYLTRSKTAATTSSGKTRRRARMAARDGQSQPAVREGLSRPAAAGDAAVPQRTRDADRRPFTFRGGVIYEGDQHAVYIFERMRMFAQGRGVGRVTTPYSGSLALRLAGAEELIARAPAFQKKVGAANIDEAKKRIYGGEVTLIEVLEAITGGTLESARPCAVIGVQCTPTNKSRRAALCCSAQAAQCGRCSSTTPNKPTTRSSACWRSPIG
jgi:hypothetical protein